MLLNFRSLSAGEMRVVGEALHAVADGPFFPDWEFHMLIGLQREQARAIAASWPPAAPDAEGVQLAVDNSLNNLLGYRHNQEAAWSQWISVDRSQLEELFSRLRYGSPGNSAKRSEQH